MLYEVKGVMQIKDEHLSRWFMDDYLIYLFGLNLKMIFTDFNFVMTNILMKEH